MLRFRATIHSTRLHTSRFHSFTFTFQNEEDAQQDVTNLFPSEEVGFFFIFVVTTCMLSSYSIIVPTTAHI